MGGGGGVIEGEGCIAFDVISGRDLGERERERYRFHFFCRRFFPMEHRIQCEISIMNHQRYGYQVR